MTGIGEPQVAQHEIRGNDLSSSLRRSQPVGGRETPHEDAADRDPPAAVPAKKSPIEACDNPATMRARTERKSARPKEMTLRSSRRPAPTSVIAAEYRTLNTTTPATA